MLLCASPQNQAASAGQHYTETSKLIVARECGAPPLSVYRHRTAEQPAHLHKVAEAPAEWPVDLSITH